MSSTSNTITYDFTGTRVLVTGGTSGIGHAIASAFADAGADVRITGTRSSAADYDGVDLTRFEYNQLDTRDTDAVDALAATTSSLDVLVNNAGTGFPSGKDEWTPDGFAESLALNLQGAQRLTVGLKDVLAASTLTGGASVVNIVSMSAFRAVPMVPGYSSSKAALVALTKNLALGWMETGIRVNALAPGLIDTPFTAPLAQLPEIMERELARVPARRMGTAEECAAAALFLSTSASAYTTGSVLAVDGGYLAF